MSTFLGFQRSSLEIKGYLACLVEFSRGPIAIPTKPKQKSIGDVDALCVRVAVFEPGRSLARRTDVALPAPSAWRTPGLLSTSSC